MPANLTGGREYTPGLFGSDFSLPSVPGYRNDQVSPRGTEGKSQKRRLVGCMQERSGWTNKSLYMGLVPRGRVAVDGH